MAEYKLALKKRELIGKKSQLLREEGLIPSVIYGNKEPINLASDYVATEKVLSEAGYHSPIDLDIDGKKQLAIVKQVQLDPVSRKIINIEFKAISAKQIVEATVPIVLINFEESEASKTFHYALTKSMKEVVVKAKPADLPKAIEIDVSKMKELDDKITAADIKLPENVEFSDKEMDTEQVVASLYDPVAEAAAREAAEKAAAEAAKAEEAEENSEEEPAAEGEEKSTEEEKPAEGEEKPAE